MRRLSKIFYARKTGYLNRLTVKQVKEENCYLTADNCFIILHYKTNRKNGVKEERKTFVSKLLLLLLFIFYFC